MLGFSKIYAEVLRNAWKEGEKITSETVASVIYFNSKPISRDHSDRPKMIRNAIMTLRRMQAEGLISNVSKEGRVNVYHVISKEKLKYQIIEEIRQLFGKDFI